MGKFDLDALKNRLSTLKNSTNRSNHMWKPKPGEHQVRILPYVHGETPFNELYFHYKKGKPVTLSPSSFGNPDPFMEFGDKLQQTGDKDDWVLGKTFAPKMRTYVPILERGKESEGVKFWGFGSQVYQELLEILTDEDYGNIYDLKEGRDITVSIKSPEETGKSYAETSIRVKPKTSPATTDPDIVAKIKVQPKITELYPEPTYDDLVIQLKLYLGASDDDGDGDSTPSASAAKSSNKASATAVSTNALEVSKQFDNIFDDDLFK